MVKDYKYYKTAKKTARENNLVIADGLCGNTEKRIFDFSLLDSVDISEQEKKTIMSDAVQTVAAWQKTSLYGKIFDKFTACDGEANYYTTRVYNKTGRKRLYCIYTLVGLKHYHKERKSVYENNYDVTETTENIHVADTCRDVEI